MAGSQLATEPERAGERSTAHDARPFIPIVLDDSSSAVAMRLCVMLRNEQNRCYPIVIRESLDGRVFLGGLIDHAGTVHRLLEIHVQHTEQLSQAPAAYREALTNIQLDER